MGRRSERKTKHFRIICTFNCRTNDIRTYHDCEDEIEKTSLVRGLKEKQNGSIYTCTFNSRTVNIRTYHDCEGGIEKNVHRARSERKTNSFANTCSFNSWANNIKTYHNFEGGIEKTSLGRGLRENKTVS